MAVSLLILLAQIYLASPPYWRQCLYLVMKSELSTCEADREQNTSLYYSRHGKNLMYH